MSPPVDKLILTSIQPIINQLRYLSINLDVKLLKQLESNLISITPSCWNLPWIFRDNTPSSVNYLGLFSCLSFCYWGNPQWYQSYYGQQLTSGSYSMFYTLKRAIDQGVDLTDAHQMATISQKQFVQLMEGENHTTIPFLKRRWQITREIGKILLNKFGGNFVHLFEQANYDADQVNALLVESFPCLQDQTTFNNQPVYFYKKSQEIITLVYEQFNGQSFGAIKNLHHLTVSSDYKLPQILTSLGILEHKHQLHKRILNQIPLIGKSRAVLEIRAATIYVGHQIVKYLRQQGHSLHAYQISNFLWTFSQKPGIKVFPFPKIYSEWV